MHKLASLTRDVKIWILYVCGENYPVFMCVSKKIYKLTNDIWKCGMYNHNWMLIR